MDSFRIKESFAKAKQDIFILQSQIDSLRRDIQELKQAVKLLIDSSIPTEKPQNQAQTEQIPTDYQHPTQTPTHNLPSQALKSQDKGISTGNRGVPTDRQTNQQTDQHIGNEGVQNIQNNQKTPKLDRISQIEYVSSILESLDGIKKDLRSKFKRLSKQEMAVFSLIYDLENQGFIVDYSLLSSKFSLSESSIRDYVQKIIKKGIPLIKIKENNKKILLKIDENLKKIASLQTLLTLREL